MSAFAGAEREKYNVSDEKHSKETKDDKGPSVVVRFLVYVGKLVVATVALTPLSILLGATFYCIFALWWHTFVMPPPLIPSYDRTALVREVLEALPAGLRGSTGPQGIQGFQGVPGEVDYNMVRQVIAEWLCREVIILNPDQTELARFPLCPTE